MKILIFPIIESTKSQEKFQVFSTNIFLIQKQSWYIDVTLKFTVLYISLFTLWQLCINTTKKFKEIIRPATVITCVNTLSTEKVLRKSIFLSYTIWLCVSFRKFLIQLDCNKSVIISAVIKNEDNMRKEMVYYKTEAFIGHNPPKIWWCALNKEERYNPEKERSLLKIFIKM